MTDHQAITDWTVRNGCEFVCELPSPAVRLGVENGCVIAYLENGDKFLVPVEAGADEVRN
jgi:hypothetical protein